MNVFKKGDRVKIKKHKDLRNIKGYSCQYRLPYVTKCINCTMFLSKVYTIAHIHNNRLELEPHDWSCGDNNWTASSFERAYKWIKIK